MKVVKLKERIDPNSNDEVVLYDGSRVRDTAMYVVCLVPALLVWILAPWNDFINFLVGTMAYLVTFELLVRISVALDKKAFTKLTPKQQKEHTYTSQQAVDKINKEAGSIFLPNNKKWATAFFVLAIILFTGSIVLALSDIFGTANKSIVSAISDYGIASVIELFIIGEYYSKYLRKDR